ncbi:MAG: glycine cleavage T C-terminal barrel domain-containing protein [Actinomycetota bacterium]|nr:glycine cleavage T C-terminal barrel domain-containing protein [Actinomycetota bacterium]
MIHIPGEIQGYATSEVSGFRTGRRVVLAFVEGGLSDRWDGINVDVLGASCPAERQAHAVYDPENLRPMP